MTWLMGDATHDCVPQLAALNGLDVVAGYVTGTPDVQWTTDDFARFPGMARVTIDQAYTGSPVASATVRDVEPGAWTPAAAVNRAGWTAARPTIYCDRNDLPTVLAGGWRGDLWLAIPGWVAGEPLPATPGCTVVAVQNDYTNPNYDLSVILDATWPLLEEDTMRIITVDKATVPTGVKWPGSWLLRCDGTLRWLDSAEYQALVHARVTEVTGYSYADWQALSGVQ